MKTQRRVKGFKLEKVHVGRPHILSLVKQPKGYLDPGRHYKRLENLLAKRKKLDMIEVLITWYEAQSNLDVEYIRDLKKRANELRSQLKVLSTLEPTERP